MVAAPPEVIDGARVLFWADVSAVSLTGAVRHDADGVPQTRFSGVAVAQYAGRTAAYLFHCGPDWTVENDDCYDSVEAAIADAERQYAGFTRDRLRAVAPGAARVSTAGRILKGRFPR